MIIFAWLREKIRLKVFLKNTDMNNNRFYYVIKEIKNVGSMDAGFGSRIKGN